MLAVYGSTFVGPFPKRIDGPSLDDHLSGIRTLITIVTVLSYVGLIANLRKASRWYARQAESANCTRRNVLKTARRKKGNTYFPSILPTKNSPTRNRTVDGRCWPRSRD